MSRLVHASALVLLGASLGCASRAADLPGCTAFVVELDALSGRPNPRWLLARERAAELDARLTDLPRAEGAPALPGGRLGYRGFRVEGRGEGCVLRRAYLAGGRVAIPGEGDGRDVVYRDVHGAEEWLKQLARDRGYGGLLP